MRFKSILSVGLLAALVGGGCMVPNTPVPTSHWKFKLGGESFEGETPKDNTLTGFELTVATNGTRTIKIQSLSATNNSNVTAAAYAGRADELKAVADGVVNGIKAGANVVGTAVGAAVKTP